MKQVIFVGGSEFSGSTIFHLMLANDPHGFACGEVESLFRPRHIRHVKRLEDIEPQGLDIWRQIYQSGEDRLYQSIFDLLPEVEFVVDSSKNPHWIHYQSENLRKQGIRTSNFLIWKSPVEFAQSRAKRNMLSGWDENWVNYHRLYLSLLNAWNSVRYQDLAGNPQATLQRVCRVADIPWFDGKQEFWQREYYHLGGNFSARIHLHEGDKARNYESRWIGGDRMQHHRQIYYQQVPTSTLNREIVVTVQRSSAMSDIVALLEQLDVSKGRPAVSSAKAPELSFSPSAVRLRKIKATLWARLGRLRYSPDIHRLLESGPVQGA